MVIIMFIIGTFLGSFYNVVGFRVPIGQSIVFPSSHCPKCNHRLNFFELIPILSYILLKGKCSKCKEKISPFYPFFEFLTGLLFALAYLSFGLTINLIIPLVFISLLIIITVSDINYMIIPDSVLLVFGVIIITLLYYLNGFSDTIESIISGIFAFVSMFILKKIGDFIFKKESMGGGDIKLLFIFGMVLSYLPAMLSIFLGSFVGLPISLLLLKKHKDHIIPFGPFLAVGAVIILLLHIDTNFILNFYK